MLQNPSLSFSYFDITVVYMFWMAIKCFWIENWNIRFTNSEWLLNYLYWMVLKRFYVLFNLFELLMNMHKGQWRGALKFSLICTWINGWVNNRGAGDLRRHRAHYDVIVIKQIWRSTESEWLLNCVKRMLCSFESEWYLNDTPRI